LDEIINTKIKVGDENGREEREEHEYGIEFKIFWMI